MKPFDMMGIKVANTKIFADECREKPYQEVYLASKSHKRTGNDKDEITH